MNGDPRLHSQQRTDEWERSVAQQLGIPRDQWKQVKKYSIHDIKQAIQAIQAMQTNQARQTQGDAVRPDHGDRKQQQQQQARPRHHHHPQQQESKRAKQDTSTSSTAAAHYQAPPPPPASSVIAPGRGDMDRQRKEEQQQQQQQQQQPDILSVDELRRIIQDFTSCKERNAQLQRQIDELDQSPLFQTDGSLDILRAQQESSDMWRQTALKDMEHSGRIFLQHHQERCRKEEDMVARSVITEPALITHWNQQRTTRWAQCREMVQLLQPLDIDLTNLMEHDPPKNLVLPSSPLPPPPPPLPPHH